MTVTHHAQETGISKSAAARLMKLLKLQ